MLGGEAPSIAIEPVSMEEPPGGWEFVWDQAKDSVFPLCRDEVGSLDLAPNAYWSPLWRCAARKAFPDVAGRLSFEAWPDWLKYQAAHQIQMDLKDHLEAAGVSSVGWSFVLWLRFDHLIDGCYEALAPHTDAITHCMASEMFPDEDWPPDANTSPSLLDFWDTLSDMIEAYVDAHATPATFHIAQKS
jgi:hypothetical protein